jgi:uncharacterized RDD family membrane protein YckC
VTSPAGWHPDPLPPTPGQPAQLRYWDGERWTEHVSPVPAEQQYYGSAPASSGPATTPDGVPLAGWWHRVGAYLLDVLVLAAVVVVVALPWIREIGNVYVDYLEQVMDDAEAGRQSTVSAIDLAEQVQRPTMIVGAIALALGFVYHVGFLMWKQGTPGKLVTGLRVRRRDVAGPMPLGTVLLRWLGQFGVGIIGLVPYIGNVSGLYNILDGLWPLWDGKKQAIHDKIAKTNVVRVR